MGYSSGPLYSCLVEDFSSMLPLRSWRPASWRPASSRQPVSFLQASLLEASLLKASFFFEASLFAASLLEASLPLPTAHGSGAWLAVTHCLPACWLLAASLRVKHTGVLEARLFAASLLEASLPFLVACCQTPCETYWRPPTRPMILGRFPPGSGRCTFFNFYFDLKYSCGLNRVQVVPAERQKHGIPEAPPGNCLKQLLAELFADF